MEIVSAATTGQVPIYVCVIGAQSSLPGRSHESLVHYGLRRFVHALDSFQVKM